MSNKTSFIAETGPSGEVVWVWRYRDGEYGAAPVRQPYHKGEDDLGTVSYYGAAPEEILRWLAAAEHA